MIQEPKKCYRFIAERNGVAVVQEKETEEKNGVLVGVMKNVYHAGVFGNNFKIVFYCSVPQFFFKLYIKNKFINNITTY